MSSFWNELRNFKPRRKKRGSNIGKEHSWNISSELLEEGSEKRVEEKERLTPREDWEEEIRKNLQRRQNGSRIGNWTLVKRK